MKLYKVFTISGSILVGVGILLEILYFAIWKDIYWILLVYPPPNIQNLIKMAPYIGGLLILIGGISIVVGIGFYLKADLERLQGL